MPSLSTARRLSNTRQNDGKTIGQLHKEASDFQMESLWDYDPQAKQCFIYDYFHDDQPDKKDHMTYENTTKTRIDAKFVVKSYQSIDKDQVEYYLQFRPSQPLEFSEGDDLYYYETDFHKRYGADFPIGLFVDLPDDRGIYHKWLICAKEIANQFVNYLILPCNYRLMWIERNGNEKLKRKMWGVIRNQNSYNSGQYTYTYTTKVENQEKYWLPLNSITEKINYTQDGKNIRVLVGAVTDHPIAWTVSKVENTNPLGLQKITFYQTPFNPEKDYVNKETGEMFADYYDNEVTPVDPIPVDIPVKPMAEISASSSSVKVGGSYRLFTVNIYDKSKQDITDAYRNANFIWKAEVENADITGDLKWVNHSEFNKIKMKFSSDRKYLGKVLVLHCSISTGKEILETEAKFDIII